MAKCFEPPAGEIVAVRVAYILSRSGKESEAEKLKVSEWELVLPEIEYLPASAS